MPESISVTIDGEWWEPFLVPAGVILAGLLAAAFSWWTTSRTFKHERRIRAQEATRGTLDEVVKTITDVSPALRQAAFLLSDLRSTRRAMLDGRETTGAYRDVAASIEDNASRLEAYTDDLLAAGFRLSIRFDGGAPIVGAFNAWRESFGELCTAYAEILKAPDTDLDKDAKTVGDLHLRLGVQLKTFLDEARASGVAR